MENLKVSIITVVRNGKNTIEQTIQSVLEQTYEDIEYIIIDGASTDGTQEIIKRYEGKLAYYVSEPDHGLYEAMNKGIRHAKGDIVGIINSDDWYEIDAVEAVVSVFQHSKAQVVHGNVYMIGEKGERWMRRPAPLKDIWSYMVLLHPTVFVRKWVYDQYGGFNEKYKIAADYELVLRLYNEQIDFVYLDKVISNFRNGGLSSREYGTAYKECLQIVQQCLRQYGTQELYAKVMEVNERYCAFENAILDDPYILEVLLKDFWGNNIKSIAIFGAGVRGARYCSLIHRTAIHPDCFFDNNAKDR